MLLIKKLLEIGLGLLLVIRNDGTSQLKWSQNIYPQILVTFKIKNLATSDCVKDWGKVAPQQGLGKEAPGKVWTGDTRSGYLGT